MPFPRERFGSHQLTSANKLSISPPEHVEVIVHNYCNFRCKMCKIWENQSPDSLPFEDVKKIIDGLAAFRSNKITLQFIGGETLFYKDLVNAIRYATRRGIKTSITTNGYLLNKDKILQLSAAGLHNVNISLDSIEREVHNEIRGIPDSYERIMEAISLFKKYDRKIVLAINTVISSVNLHTLIRLSRFILDESRINGLYFIALDKPYSSDYPDDWMKKSDVSYLWPADKTKIIETFQELIFEKRVNIKLNNSVMQLKKYRDYYLNPDIFIKKFGCKFGDTNMYITQIGEIRLCTKRPDFMPIGNIHNKNMLDIWESNSAKETRQKMEQCRQNCTNILSCAFKDE